MRARSFGSAVLQLLLLVSAVVWPASQAVAQQPAAVEPQRVLITVGRSTVLPTDFDITRIAITNPVIADAVVVAPREVLIDGKGAGTVSLIIWGPGRRSYSRRENETVFGLANLGDCRCAAGRGGDVVECVL